MPGVPARMPAAANASWALWQETMSVVRELGEDVGQKEQDYDEE